MDLAEGIMNEITLYCRDECCSCDCCPEDECVLFRIERMVIESECGKSKGIVESNDL